MTNMNFGLEYLSYCKPELGPLSPGEGALIIPFSWLSEATHRKARSARTARGIVARPDD